MTIEESINNVIVSSGVDTNKISDGYHTFDELYKHRIYLYLALCKLLSDHFTTTVWHSKVHSDGSIMDGWFILGINVKQGEQITYHLPLEYWNKVDQFSDPLAKAPEYDGHTSDDVLTRLFNI